MNKYFELSNKEISLHQIVTTKNGYARDKCAEGCKYQNLMKIYLKYAYVYDKASQHHLLASCEPKYVL